jgi:TonB family protein
MISIRTCVGLVACCVGSLVVSLMAHAAGMYVATAGGPADERRIAEWMQVVDSATVITFRHRVVVHRPVRFKTRKPCLYRLSRVLGEDRLEGTAPTRFARALGLWEHLPDTTSCRSGPCRTESHLLIGATGDTLISHSFDLTFRRSGREVTFAIACAEELAWISDSSKCWACLPVPHHLPGLIALAHQSFPWDSLVDRIKPCEPAAADSGSPLLGGYVYVEVVPEAIERQPPKYPDKARAAGAGGTVIVQALIGKDGEVRRTAIAESIPLLDQAAVQAVERWRFRPAMSNGEPVAVWVAVPVKFTLQD